MAALTDHRRRRLEDALRIARGAVRALEAGTKDADPDALALAGQALQEAGRVAQRQAAHIGAPAEVVEPLRRLSPMRGGRRAGA